MKKLTHKQIAKEFIEFLSAAKTPFHAVKIMSDEFKKAGFVELDEKDSWTLKKGGKYFVIRGDSGIIAFKLGKKPVENIGFHIIGAHTDSPSLKIKANPDKSYNGYLSLGVEPYGGAILSSWFDRDLSIAGRVSYLDAKNALKSTLLDFERPVAVIPNLAIHLSPKKNDSNTINKQSDLPPLFMLSKGKEGAKFYDFLIKEISKSLKSEKIKEILGYDLLCYDTQPPRFVGYQNEFICGQRLDNLLSCFVGMKALLDCDGPGHSMLVCNDNEEVGSESYTGAAGTFLKSILERISKGGESYQRLLAKSMLVSVDNAHGVHPNYQIKHDENHKPILNKGPVIKINANQRYATNSDTSARFTQICKKAKIPVQKYINRSDMACGTTIGPITATNLGLDTVDIGAATFAMHSIRETCGSDDILYMYKALMALYNDSGN